MAALKKCCEIIKEHQSSNPGEMEHPIVYVMACRIGPFMKHYYQEIHKLGGKVYLNPDGHEWKRAKWSAPIRKYWKESERMMVKWSDLVICDSVTIEKYIHECYNGKCGKGKGIGDKNLSTTYIAYGAETRKSTLSDDSKRMTDWYERKGLRPHEYYPVSYTHLTLPTNSRV